MKILRNISDNDGFVTFLLFAISALVIFAGIGLRGAWPADEPRFVEIVKEMLVSGNWLVPMRGGEFYPDKPPLFFWLMAGITKLTGSLAISFLVPSALAGLGTLWMVFDLGKRFVSERAGQLAALLLMVTPQFLMQVKSAQIDAVIMCWVTLGCYGFLRHFILGPNWPLYFIAWVAMGLGVITKGVGFLPVFMLIPLALHAWQGGELGTGDKLNVWQGKVLLGPLLMLLVICAWLVPLLWHINGEGTLALQNYADDLFFKQTAKRYTNAWHHRQPWYFFFIAVIPKLWLPVSLLLVGAGRLFYQKCTVSKLVFVLLVWVFCVLVFFSLSNGKRAVYILPALPMLSLATAMVFHDQRLPQWYGKIIDGCVIIALSLCALVALAVLQNASFITKAIVEFDPIADQLAWLLLLSSVVIAVAMYASKKRPALERLFIVTSMTWLVVSFFAYPLLDPLKRPAGIYEAAIAKMEPGAELGLLQYKESFLLYAPMDLVTFGYLPKLAQQERNAWQWINASSHRYLLVSSDIQSVCFDLSKGVQLGRLLRKKWLLLTSDSAALDCASPSEMSQFYVPFKTGI